ncbi:7316_t:CDS:2, partial [Racocetra persica]
STNQKPIVFNSQNSDSDLNNKWENETDQFDNENEMDYFDDENELDYSDNAQTDKFEKNNTNTAEPSLHTEIIENITLFQECSKLYDTSLEPSYNPVQCLYNPPLLKENYVIQWIVICQVLTFLDIFQFQNFPKSQHYVEKIIAQPDSILKYTPLVIYPYQSIITRISSILADESNEQLMDSPFKRQLWSGQLFKTTRYPIGRMFRCALIQIVCDIPAA